MGANNDQVHTPIFMYHYIDIVHCRWCTYIRHLSSSAYELLCTSGVLRLPSQRTLRDYTYYTQSCSGFSVSVDQQLMDLAKIDSCPERDKYVVIIMDEMHVRENIVYDKHTGIYLCVCACLHKSMCVVCDIESTVPVNVYRKYSGLY